MGVVVFSRETGQCANIGAILASKKEDGQEYFINFKCWRIEAYVYMSLKTIFRQFYKF
jgi:hypothetical protein